MITLRKVNDVHLHFSGPRDELRMLSDYFTFKVPGAEFSPQYRNKFWDGKIRLANLQTQQIYLGLYNDIAKFSKDMDIDVEFAGSKYEIPGREQPVDDSTLEGFIKTLNPHSKNKPIEMRDYQLEAFKLGVRNQRGLIVSPTASGKSLIIYALIRWWQQVHDRKILIVVPTTSLVTQMINDFSDYSQGKFNDITGITAGVSKEINTGIVVSTWQSIYKMPTMWFAQFGSVIVDEVHHAQSKSIQGFMNKMLVCPDRIGLTGTLQDTKTHELVLKGLFGPVYKMVSTKELIDRDEIAQLKVNILQLKYPEIECKKLTKLNYQEEITYLIENENRNKFISRLANTLKGNTLVIFSRIEHGKVIYDLIETEKQKHYVAGETDKDTREVVRQMAENNDVIIVASMGVFSTGVNIKNLQNLIFAHPSKSKIKVLQSIGRILRKTEEEKIATVYDIVDDLKYKSKENFALKHSKERFKFYVLENFEYKISKVNI